MPRPFLLQAVVNVIYKGGSRAGRERLVQIMNYCTMKDGSDGVKVKELDPSMAQRIIGRHLNREGIAETYRRRMI